MSEEFSLVTEASVANWQHSTDIVVVGLGCAGAAAAIEATNVGGQVIVLERASSGGGTSALSGGVIYLGGGTPLQKACGFEDSPDEMYKYMVASCGDKADPERIRAYCDGSVEHYRWFLDQDVPFKPVFYPHYSGEPPNEDGLVFSGSENAHPFNQLAIPAPRGHVPQTEGQAGGLLMRKLIGAVKASHAEIQTDTRVEHLIASSDGRIIGVMARCAGETHTIRASRGVILSAGGFINNKAMLQTHAPLLRKCKFRVGAEGDDGSGIRLGTAAGALAIGLEMGSISLPIIPPKSVLRGIMVNAQGQRFINEDVYYGRLGEYALYRADGRAFLILDERTFVRPEVPREVVAVGETIEELERELGLPRGSLEATLTLYNQHAQKSEDPVFNKASEYVTPLLHPPFGALDCTTENSLYAVFTLGGLKTNVHGQALNADDVPIPGLYAAGRTSASLAAPGYSSGISIGDATFFARRAASHALNS